MYNRRYVSLLTFFFLTLFACNSSYTTGVFEKNIAIPEHAWSTSYKPEIRFTVEDTTARYNIYAVIRHTDAYRYRNIWLKVHIESPNGVKRSQPLELKLATDDKGWLGSGMDDLFEHRILITPPQNPEKLTAGTYTFRLEQLMREDPLEYVMNAGIRVEKAK